MEILAVLVMIFRAATSVGPEEIKPAKKVQTKPEESNRYANRPYGSVKYLEDK